MPVSAIAPRAQFNATRDELELIHKIAKRAQKLYKKLHGKKLDLVSMEMDLDATHSNGCPMNFEKLLAADDFNLLHDVIGISNHIDRNTGELTGHFLPRCSKEFLISPIPFSSWKTPPRRRRIRHPSTSSN
jgi:hypothetical protein